MGFKRFSVLLVIRLVLVFAGLITSGLLLITPGLYAATTLSLLVTVALVYEVYSFVSRTNQELTRFLDAARYADFGQRFQFPGLGAGFENLGETFTQILDRFREDRREQEVELRQLRALLEHVPVPLISIRSDDSVVLWNNAARRLFGSQQLSRISDLDSFGLDFREQLESLKAGERRLVRFSADDMTLSLTVSASELTVGSKVERLISLMNIQTELDGMQLSAWQDLVRVLTHEIMNSITPVASLARTAVDLVDDARSRVQGQEDIVTELVDARDAVDTVARRSDGLMNFVSSYRELTKPLTPGKERFLIQDLFADLYRIVMQDWPTERVQFSVNVEPSTLDLVADRQLIEQVLINLLQNAEHALDKDPDGIVQLNAKLNPRGHVTISVTDNGPGIAAEIAPRVFVPFFTTRKEGSGVGLALSRQIMIAHGGTLTYHPARGGGAEFRLVF